jgi:transposase
MTRLILTERAWDSLQNFFVEAGLYATTNLRKSIEGILWRMRTGSPWRDLPPELGAWNAVYRLFNRWVHNGTLDILLEFVEGKIDYKTAYIDGSYVSAHQHSAGAASKDDEGIGLSRGGRTTKIHAVCDRNGKPVDIDITAGNVSDIKNAERMVDYLAPIFDEIVADKGYDSDSFRAEIIEAGSTPIIPIKSNSQRPNHGFHKSKYKKRHLIENLFARLKHYRGIATRYDKLKKMFEGTVKMGIIAIWLGLKVR